MSKPKTLQISTCAPINGVMNVCSMHLIVLISARTARIYEYIFMRGKEMNGLGMESLAVLIASSK